MYQKTSPGKFFLLLILSASFLFSLRVYNIISRIEFLNGAVHFDSNMGRGTNVILEIPI